VNKKNAEDIDVSVVRLQKKLESLPGEYSETVVSGITQNLTQLYTLIKGDKAVM
jgi:hypothetical protein